MRIDLHPAVEIRGVPRLLGRRPLLAFFLLAFGLTWLYELLIFGLLHLPLLPWAIPGIFAPALAAFLVTAAAPLVGSS